MVDQCFPFEYGTRDGTIISEEEFFATHPEPRLTPERRERLIQNLECQGLLALKEFGSRNDIELEGFCATFIYKDPITQELYFKPIEIDIRIFFRKVTPILLLYDMRYGV